MTFDYLTSCVAQCVNWKFLLTNKQFQVKYVELNSIIGIRNSKYEKYNVWNYYSCDGNSFRKYPWDNIVPYHNEGFVSKSLIFRH